MASTRRNNVEKQEEKQADSHTGAHSNDNVLKEKINKTEMKPSK